jgi:uncharacterized membrane protein YhaH (DUF805 family)
MFSDFSVTGSVKQAAILISLIIVITVVDSQFINVFYATDFGTPSNMHLLLFVSFVILASITNTMLLLSVNRHDIQARISRRFLFRIAYIGTLGVQYTLLLIMLIIISEMVIFHSYNKELYYYCIFGIDKTLKCFCNRFTKEHFSFCNWLL